MQTPYYAVIFTSLLKTSSDTYEKMGLELEELAKEQPGYLGFESVRNHLGISISYWQSLDAIKAWKKDVLHMKAQQQGKTEWYSWYKVRIAKIEHEYEFESDFVVHPKNT